MSNLVQGLYRENLCALRMGPNEIRLGNATQVIAPAQTGLPFKRLRVTGWPVLKTKLLKRELRSGGAFIRAIAQIVPGWDQDPLYARLRSDFHNSLSNLLLNRLLMFERRSSTIGLEPAFQGHHTYPFPGLRVGPSIEDVITCSHLNVVPAKLALLEVGELLYVTQGDENAASFLARVYGLSSSDTAKTNLSKAAVIPVHPWQLSVSPVLKALLQAGKARVLDVEIPVMPLASQRTCRVLASGYDIKLPVDAVITGEYRLLYRLNCANAVAVSSALRTVVERAGMSPYFSGQFDIASILHPIPELSPTLSAIVRAPVADYDGDCVAAINLWTGPCQGMKYLQNHEQAENFFRQYCLTLLKGPLELLLEHGMATEPHLQNAIFAFDHEGMPQRLIVRDIDATVLDPERWRYQRHAAVECAISPETWEHMPAFSEGCKRTMYAMHYGHLSVVIDFIAHFCGYAPHKLVALMNDVWLELISSRSSSAQLSEDTNLLGHYREAIRVCLAARVQRDEGLRFTV